MSEGKILQIIPAVGWFAVFSHKSEGAPDSYDEVICWALVEEKDGERIVIGMSSYGTYVDTVEETANFDGYVTLRRLQDRDINPES